MGKKDLPIGGGTMSGASRLLAALMFCVGAPVLAEEGSLAGRAHTILTKYCHQCHGRDGSAKGGFSFVLDREQLVSRGLVVPGRPAESELYRKLQAKEMPPSGKPRPQDTEVAALRDWITAGAPAATPTVRGFISNADVARYIH